MTNKFEVQEDAVRTTADRISKRQRRMRKEFNGMSRHLNLDPEIVKELKKEGHLVWANDDLKGHLLYLEDIGYRYVTNREAYGERSDKNPDDKAMVRYGVADEKNTPQDIYLMVQPWEFYYEDQAAAELQNDLMDRKIETGEDEELKLSTGRKVQYSTNHN